MLAARLAEVASERKLLNSMISIKMGYELLTLYCLTLSGDVVKTGWAFYGKEILSKLYRREKGSLLRLRYYFAPCLL
jgi:hypothetical protein